MLPALPSFELLQSVSLLLSCDVLADTVFLCDKAAVLGEMIKEIPCKIPSSVLLIISILFTHVLTLITFTFNTHFGLAITDHRGVMHNTTACNALPSHLSMQQYSIM